MKLNFNADLSDIEKDIERFIQANAKRVIQQQISEFFSQNERHVKRNGVSQLDKVTGAGYGAIQKKIVSFSNDDELQAQMHTYFEENWKRFLDEAMQKAASRAAHKLVFNRREVKPVN